MEREHYRAAAECYRNAQQTELMHRAAAHAAELKGDSLSAANHWEQAGEFEKAAGCYEQAEHYEDASRIYELLQLHDRAERCNIRQFEHDKRFAEAAELCEQVKELGRAKENWLRAQKTILMRKTGRKPFLLMLNIQKVKE
ncbi:hypothetical protein L0244_06515 [bacterium]|nr:hypothetical protein [bacterium]MCI0612625.1 hypothetical protein [bacterium]